MELNKENQHIVMQWNDSFLLLLIWHFKHAVAKKAKVSCHQHT
jgi:hypothetical protein